VADDRGTVFVAAMASDAVSRFTVGPGVLAQDGCIQQGSGAADGCSPGRALNAPQDLALYGGGLSGFDPADRLAVASSASDGVALLGAGTAAPTQAAGAAGCITEGGTAGCAAQTGLRGATRVVRAGGQVYVAAPGSAAVTLLGGGSVAAPTSALASPPGPRSVPADAGTFEGSHVYAGGAGVAPFRRASPGGALSALPRPAFAPTGAVGGLAVSGDWGSLALYAAVPSAGAVLAFERNIPPSCGGGFAPLAPTKVTAPAARVPVGCSDPNGDALAYTMTGRPTLGHLIGFDGDAALYRGPFVNRSRRTDSFTVTASDGGATTTRTVQVELDYLTDSQGNPAGRPRFRVLDRRVRMDRAGRIRLRVLCTTRGGSPCRARLAVRGARGVARKSATLRSGRTARLRLRLPQRTRRAVRSARAKGLVVTVTATARDGAGRKGTGRRRVRVLAPR
jgi:hypothetical protein